MSFLLMHKRFKAITKITKLDIEFIMMKIVLLNLRNLEAKMPGSAKCIALPGVLQ